MINSYVKRNGAVILTDKLSIKHVTKFDNHHEIDIITFENSTTMQ